MLETRLPFCLLCIGRAVFISAAGPRASSLRSQLPPRWDWHGGLQAGTRPGQRNCARAPSAAARGQSVGEGPCARRHRPGVGGVLHTSTGSSFKTRVGRKSQRPASPHVLPTSAGPALLARPGGTARGQCHRSRKHAGTGYPACPWVSPLSSRGNGGPREVGAAGVRGAGPHPGLALSLHLPRRMQHTGTQKVTRLLGTWRGRLGSGGTDLSGLLPRTSPAARRVPPGTVWGGGCRERLRGESQIVSYSRGWWACPTMTYCRAGGHRCGGAGGTRGHQSPALPVGMLFWKHVARPGEGRLGIAAWPRSPPRRLLTRSENTRPHTFRRAQPQSARPRGLNRETWRPRGKGWSPRCGADGPGQVLSGGGRRTTCRVIPWA